LNFKGLRQILDAAFYQYVSDNDDNPAPLTHKENIKFGQLYIYQNAFFCISQDSGRGGGYH